MNVWGRRPASLTSWLMVRKISLSVFTGNDYAIAQLSAMGCSPHGAGDASFLSSLTDREPRQIRELKFNRGLPHRLVGSKLCKDGIEDGMNTDFDTRNPFIVAARMGWFWNLGERGRPFRRGRVESLVEAITP